MELFVLFATSLLAATIVPAQSEAVLVTLHLGGHYSASLLVLIATFGNVLGACINWLLGRYLLTLQHRRWFPVTLSALTRATRYYQRWGLWSLLFTWVPLIGDPLTIIAGFLRTHFLIFIAIVALGKAARYIALIAAF